jgi:tRNA-dihydrouridine synthase B
MAGYTDSAYRQIVKEIEPNIVCFSELTSINAIEHGSKKTLKMLEFNKSEQPLITQLFGNDPEFFAEAGKKITSLPASERPCGIDINMGCPASKVIKNCSGSAILKDPTLAGKIVSALCKSTSLPISVKMRIGYTSYEEDYFLNFIKILEKAGAHALTIHGRTTRQGYSGEANFEPIYLAKNTLKIPVIGNGDIDSAEKALETPLDGLMIGRASIGNPWLMKEIYQSLHKKSRKTITPPTFPQKLPTIKKHLHLAIALYGERIGLLEMRKHLAEYISGMPNASKYRQEIMQTSSPEEVLDVLDSIPG